MTKAEAIKRWRRQRKGKREFVSYFLAEGTITENLKSKPDRRRVSALRSAADLLEAMETDDER